MVLVIGMFGYSCIKVVLKLFDYLVDVFGEGVDVVWFDCGEYCDLQLVLVQFVIWFGVDDVVSLQDFCDGFGVDVVDEVDCVYYL